MEKAKKLTLKLLGEAQARIDALEQQLTGLDSERDRCQVAIERGVTDGAHIRELKAQREEEIAHAFLENREPLLASIDSAIADEEATKDKALVDAEAAKLALALIERQAASLGNELDSARAQLNQDVVVEMEGRATTLMSDYVRTVESLGETLAQLVATNRAMAIFGKERNALGFFAGEYLFDRLKKERLPIPWSHSERPYQVLPFTVNAGVEVDHMASPTWMTNEQLFADATAALMAELASAGVRNG